VRAQSIEMGRTLLADDQGSESNNPKMFITGNDGVQACINGQGCEQCWECRKLNAIGITAKHLNA
jgi:hypothetical protein